MRKENIKKSTKSLIKTNLKKETKIPKRWKRFQRSEMSLKSYKIDQCFYICFYLIKDLSYLNTSNLSYLNNTIYW